MEQVKWLEKVMKMQSGGFEFQNTIRFIAIPLPGNPGY